MPIPPKMKVRGANMMRPKISNVHPKHKTKNFMLMKGDLVQVMRGKHEGCRGIIETVIKKHDKVKVEGVAMQVKHMKPNPFFPKGQYFKKETPIPYQDVQLIDTVEDKPCKFKFIKKCETPDAPPKLFRLTNFGNYLPLPEKPDEFKGLEETPSDTPIKAIEQVTFLPDLNKCPFPPSFMNELERMKRKNRETQAL